MNLAKIYYLSGRYIVRAFQLLKFYAILKPLWRISYNRNGNRFECAGKMFNCKIMLKGGGNSIIIGKGVKLNNVIIEITGNHNTLIIEDNSVIAENGKLLIKDSNNTIKIGKNADIRGVFIASSDINTKIEIGNNALISSQVVIRSSDVHSIVDDNGIRINPGKDVIIGDSVWIGYGSTILKGSIIGDNSVIGSQTLVSNMSIPSGSVVGGCPGKIIKSNISWRKERIYEN